MIILFRQKKIMGLSRIISHVADGEIRRIKLPLLLFLVNHLFFHSFIHHASQYTEENQYRDYYFDDY